MSLERWIFGLALLAESVAPLPAQERFYPVRHAAKEDPSITRSQFALVGETGRLAALQHDDGIYDVSAWIDNAEPPLGAPRVRVWTEFDFDSSGSGITASAVTSLRFLAEVYRSGEDGAWVVSPPLFDDSSEEDAIHALHVEIFDFARGGWDGLSGMLLPGASYAPGALWRDTAYAQRWSRPTPNAGAYAGPHDFTRAGSLAGGHISVAGLMRLRILEDLSIGPAGWDVTQVFEQCCVEIDAGSGAQRFVPVAYRARGDALSAEVFARSGENGTAAALAARDQSYAVSYWQDARLPASTIVPPSHYELWSELEFAVQPTAIPLGEHDLLRLELEVYSSGWQPSALAEIPDGPPPAFDDASEENAIHRAEVQAWDWSAASWTRLRDWFDPTLYAPGSPGWRSSSYAARWSRPGASAGAYPGPLRFELALPASPFVNPLTQQVLVRLWKDADLGTYASWDIVHAIDAAWLEALPRGLRTFGTGCPGIHRATPWIRAGAIPDVQLGTPSFPIYLENAEGAGFALLWLGFFTLSSGIPLEALGAPGCGLYVLPEIPLPGTPVSAATQVLSIALPANGLLLGGALHAQWIFANQGANALGQSFSNALAITFQ